MVIPFYLVYSNGGFTKGGLNFDAKIRRQSIDPEDIFYAHIGGMDTCAKTLLAVEKIINDKKISDYIDQRYKHWENDLGKKIHSKDTSLETLHEIVIKDNLSPKNKSGQQEMLENIINKYL